MVDEFENGDGVLLRDWGFVQEGESVFCKRREGQGLRKVAGADVGFENRVG